MAQVALLATVLSVLYPARTHTSPTMFFILSRDSLSSESWLNVSIVLIVSVSFLLAKTSPRYLSVWYPRFLSRKTPQPIQDRISDAFANTNRTTAPPLLSRDFGCSYCSSPLCSNVYVSITTFVVPASFPSLPSQRKCGRR